MKKTLLSLLLIFSVTVNSQNFNIKNGVEFKSDLGSIFEYYIGNDANSVYLKGKSTKGSGINQVIQKIDSKTLDLVYEKGFELEKYEKIWYTFFKENQIFIFTQKFDKNEKKLYVLLRQISSSTGELIGDVKQIFSSECPSYSESELIFNVSFSPDDKKMVIVSLKTPVKQAFVYETSTFKKLTTKEIIKSYKQSTVSCFNYRVDNNGAFFYLFYYMNNFEKKTTSMAVANFQQTANQAIITQLEIDENKDLVNGTFQFLNNNLAFCGLFKDNKNEVGVGVFSFFIDSKTNDIINKRFDYFSYNVFSKLDYQEGLLKKNPAGKFYSFEELITVNDCVYLIESHSYEISGNGYYSYERELIVSKFNKTGKLEWMKIIPKYTVNNLNNFNYLVRNNKIYFFYAEHPKNIENSTIDEYDPKKYMEIKNFNGSLLVCTTLEEDGKLNRKVVFENKGWCYDPVSTNVILEKDNGLLLRMINKSKVRYDKITID